MKQCSECGGQGVIRRNQKMGHITYQQRVECPSCQGSGFAISQKDKCPYCSGGGRKRVTETINMVIPKGLSEGGRVIIPEKADEIPGVRTGDLVCFPLIDPHPFFTRVDNIDLEFTAEISLLEALTGFKRKVKLLSGEILTIRREDVTPHGM